jgi:hypothetical protein
MFKLNSREKIQLFFRELFNVLKNAKKNWNNPWIEIPKIEFFNNLNSHDINEIVLNFSFLKKEAFKCVSINKIQFIIEAMAILNYDIKIFSQIIDYRGFELLIKEILSRSGYYVINNFYFSDNSPLKEKYAQKRYEIDIVGLKEKFLLLIDAKQWFKRSPSQAIGKAANLQYQRGLILIHNPEILYELLNKLLKSFKRKNIKRINEYLPLTLVPLMVTLEENNMKLNKNHIPLVCINRLNSFLNELGINLDHFLYLKVENLPSKTIH